MRQQLDEKLKELYNEYEEKDGKCIATTAKGKPCRLPGKLKLGKTPKSVDDFYCSRHSMEYTGNTPEEINKFKEDLPW